jgi:hypothetical protein
MRETATDSVRSRRRVGRTRLSTICGATLVPQIITVALVPPHLRWAATALLAVTTFTVTIVLAVEISFSHAAVQAAGAAAARADPRGPSEPINPLIQRAYYMARHDLPASHIAKTCDIPEAFAALIIDDVRQAAPRHGGRKARRAP